MAPQAVAAQFTKLFDLPTELRLIIYKLVLFPDGITQTHDLRSENCLEEEALRGRPGTSAQRPTHITIENLGEQVPLLQVSARIRSEALPIYLANNMFNWHLGRFDEWSTAELEAKYKSKVRQIRFSIEGLYINRLGEIRSTDNFEEYPRGRFLGRLALSLSVNSSGTSVTVRSTLHFVQASVDRLQSLAQQEASDGPLDGEYLCRLMQKIEDDAWLGYNHFYNMPPLTQHGQPQAQQADHSIGFWLDHTDASRSNTGWELFTWTKA